MVSQHQRAREEWAPFQHTWQPHSEEEPAEKCTSVGKNPQCYRAAFKGTKTVISTLLKGDLPSSDSLMWFIIWGHQNDTKADAVTWLADCGQRWRKPKTNIHKNRFVCQPSGAAELDSEIEHRLCTGWKVNGVRSQWDTDEFIQPEKTQLVVFSDANTKQTADTKQDHSKCQVT